jgi:predicted dehydrogenase
MPDTTPRRNFLRTASAAALFSPAFLTPRAKGANDRITIAHIGLGRMGTGNLTFAMETGFEVVALCDVYQPALEKAQSLAQQHGQNPKLVRDFREILADKSIDAVCISTPDHWHAYMTVEACKAGKDVYVEKPASVYVNEGLLMVEAARKFNRIVQGGTMQRSGYFFKKAAAIVKSGDLGYITFCRTWQSGLTKKGGYGYPQDSPPPSGLDWDLWLGPAPQRPFNANRWGVKPDAFSTFRYFWDYAGGPMTDWNVHLLDIVHYAFDDKVMPVRVTGLGDKYFVEDNTETPDTMVATYQYPNFLCTYESRTAAPAPLFDETYGTAFIGTKGTLVVNRGGYKVIPVDKTIQPVIENDKAKGLMNLPHWQNFMDCVKSRQRPIAEIETTVRTSTSCILSNLAMRYDTMLDWDDAAKTVKQSDIRPDLEFRYRAPWTLDV